MDKVIVDKEMSIFSTYGAADNAWLILPRDIDHTWKKLSS